MPTTTVDTTPAGVALATYDTDHHGPRVLIGARIDGDPDLFDVPPPTATTGPATSSNEA
jgi:hypothetical protein